MTDLKVTAIAPWFGSNRMLAEHVGRALAGMKWVGVPFAGGMCELACIEARTLNVNDLHKHVINLARVAADPAKGPALYRRLKRIAFHPDELRRAQERCLLIERCDGDADELFTAGCEDPRFSDKKDLEWAVDYFVAAWMPRHGSSGRKGEFKVGISTRWNAAGGDSCTHYRSAIQSLTAWRRVMRRANFVSMDFREFLDLTKDEAGHGLYCDPPFPGPGDAYRHTFTIADHRDLSRRLTAFEFTKVVCRFYEHELVQELYPESAWTWTRLEGRKQTNDEAPEVLLTKRLRGAN